MEIEVPFDLLTNKPISTYIKILIKRHHLEALGNKDKDLYQFILQSLEMMSFV